MACKCDNFITHRAFILLPHVHDTNSLCEIYVCTGHFNKQLLTYLLTYLLTNLKVDFDI